MTTRQSGRWLWATVTGTSPLEIRLDGESTPLLDPPDTLIPPADLVAGVSRVWVQQVGAYVIIHGKAR